VQEHPEEFIPAPLCLILNLFKIMKKNSIRDPFVYKRKFKNYLLMMKFTLLITFLGILNASASLYSQNASLNLSVEKRTVKEVFREIEKQSKFRFLYNDDFLDLDQLVSMNVKETHVEEILNKLFLDAKITYRILDNNLIVITPADFSVKQQQKVTGTVTDATNGEPIIGANILIEGTTVGVVTDVNGKFSLDISKADAVIVVSYLGFNTERITVNGQSVLDVKLVPDITKLDEVVVIGYGTQKKSDLTGAITSVKGGEITGLPVRSVAEALQGKVAGVMITKDDGSPGSGSQITIRGVGSLNGLSPLFVIDGIARGNNPNFNPKDIESIEVIKDASAAAIYGAQAAGGVVLITTKKGSLSQDIKFDFNAHSGVRNIAKKYDFLNTNDYIRARQGIGQNYAIWNDPASLPNTNWQNELFKTGGEQSYSLSAQGGTNKLAYYISLGYEKEKGIQINNYWERFSIRANADYHPNKKFTFGHQLYLYKTDNDTAHVNVPWTSLPYMAVYNPDGSYAHVPVGVEFSGSNAVAQQRYQHIKGNTIGAQLNFYADWELLKGLHLKSIVSGDFSNNYGDNFTETDLTGRQPIKAIYRKSFTLYQLYTSTTTLSWQKLFVKKHELNLMVGYEVKQGSGSNINATAVDFPVQVSQSFDLSLNPNKSATGTLYNDGQYLSQFGRLNYTFDNRFLLTANIRRDGSPKFGPDNRFGVFPSVSAGWKLQNEQFFKNLNLNSINTFKPRVSWGILGNEATLGSYLYQPAYSPVGLYSPDGKSSVSGYSNIKIINKDIRWEQIKTVDVGLDMELFNKKLSVSADYYDRETSDMIYYLSVPTSSGITAYSANNATAATMPVNIGKISNKGYEIAISWKDTKGDFRYNIGGNISHNDNLVVDLGVKSALYSGTATGFSGISPFKTINGQPIGQIYGYKVDGIIQNQAEIDALNATAVSKNGTVSYYNSPFTGPGDLKFRDLDGDGKITDKDRTYIGNPWPKFQYGFNIDLGWKGFDLAAQIIGVAGRDVLNTTKAFEQFFVQDCQATYQIFGASNFLGNGVTSQPRLGFTNSDGNYINDPNQNYRTFSSYFVENGSYLKVKNIEVGYTLPKSILAKLKIESLRIYLTGQNLLTFTKFTGLDPEFSNDVKNYGLYNTNNLPQTKLFSTGIEITF